MCLFISSDPKKNREDLQNFTNGQEEIIVYKILVKYEDEDFYRSSSYMNFRWDLDIFKEFQIDRPSKPTNYELESGEVHIGFHVYTSPAHITSCAANISYLVKFKVRAGDIVAVENYYSDKEFNFQRAVCQKLIFIEVIGKFEGPGQYKTLKI